MIDETLILSSSANVRKFTRLCTEIHLQNSRARLHLSDNDVQMELMIMYLLI